MAEPKPRHKARVDRRQRLQNQIAVFVRQYERKSSPGYDPNDRGYDRNVERRVKRMKPEDLDDLLHGEE